MAPSRPCASLPDISCDAIFGTPTMDQMQHRVSLRLGHRLRVATGLILWGGAECLALWRSRRRRVRRG